MLETCRLRCGVGVDVVLQVRMFLCFLGLCPLAMYRFFRGDHGESSSMTERSLRLRVTRPLADPKLDILGLLNMFNCEGELVRSTT